MSAPARAVAFALALACCIPDQDEPLCLGGSTECGQRCVSLAIDPGNCGACGNACGAGEVCREGACGAPCGAGLTLCDGHCVELGGDPAHCGACGAACDAELVCVEGSCADDCFGDSLRCGDLCVDGSASHEHCGGCDAPCAPEEACIGGECTPACGGGLSCGAACVDGDTDGANCGACGHACLAGRACVGGECEPYCGPKPCDACEAWWATAWTVDADTTGTPATKAVATGPDGRIFVAVDFVGEATFGAQTYVTSNQFTDIAVMELDAKGGVVWAEQIGGNGAERARGLAVLDADHLVLTGDFGGTMTVGAQVVTTAGAQDGFVAALSSSGGAPIWTTQLASTGTDRIGPVAVTANEIVVGGAYGAQATLAGTVLPAPFGKDDAFLARLDPASGAAIWATGFGADQDDSIEDVVLSAGSVYVAGAIGRDSTAMVPAPVIVQIGAFTLTLTAKMGGLLAAFSEGDGAAVWASLLSNESPLLTGSQAHASTLARAPDGTLWMLGRFAGTLTLDSGAAGSTAATWDAVLVHLDAAGAELGAWPFGGIGTEFPLDLAVDDAGRIVATGSFNGEIKLGDDLTPNKVKLVATPAAPATTDIWLASFDPPMAPTSPPVLRCARSFGDEAVQLPSSLSLVQGVAYLGGRLIGTMEVEPGITVSASAGATSAFVAAFGY